MEERQEWIQRALHEAERLLGEVEKERENLQRRAQALQREVEGLQLALSAYDSFAPSSMTPEAPNSWRFLPRTEAIERLAAESGFDPLHRKEIQKQLQMRGREDDVRDVSAALAHLKRSGRAENFGGGFWRILIKDAARGDALDLELTSQSSEEAAEPLRESALPEGHN